jgi:hypothetical protein
MARGRKKIDVPADQLINTIQELESKSHFNNRQELYEAVANSDWGVRMELTPSVVYLRIREFNITPKTPPGKKGRVISGQMGVRVSKEEKFKTPQLQSAFERLTKSTPQKFHGIIKKVRKGSLKSAVKLKCLECSSYDKSSIRFCPVTNCPIFAFRPYK